MQCASIIPISFVHQRCRLNSTLAIGGVPSPLDSFEVTESSVLQTNFCAEKPAHRQSANRQVVKKLPKN